MYIIGFTICIALGVFLAWQNPSWIANIKLEIKDYRQYHQIKKKLWNRGFHLVSIKSSSDGKNQEAYYYSSKASNSKPLIVSLHTWAGDYREYDSIALMSKSKNINYIHPNFRGSNTTPNSCCSPLALSDIDDAIDFAIDNGNVDLNKIYVIGKSGGGLATLSLFMKSKHNINTFSSWVPISDLNQWYKEGIIRNSEFTDDIVNCTSSDSGHLDPAKAKERSPMYWPTPTEERKNAKLKIFAGVYDGITGNVPITHSIHFYNKVVAAFGAVDSLDYVSEEQKIILMAKRNSFGDYGKISDRSIFFQKRFKNIELIIFEGGHEMLTSHAFKDLLD
ncbi:MAG TPA: peptidase [Pricia antarctica]|uniref:Peptidase n=1 Tax=Pricia antarctica TaxID=641691 RepID=A0A831QSB6_9FLAO|nr:peptidase [Pricia antarctica]